LSSPKVDVNLRTSKGLTPIHLAAIVGSLQVINILLEKGADIDASCDFGDFSNITPLVCAVIWGRHHREVIIYLVERGANVDVKITAGNDILTLSELAGVHGQEFRHMINALERTRELISAAKVGDLGLLKRAIRAGKDFDTKDSAEAVEFDINSQDSSKEGKKRTALHWACFEGNVDCVSELLQSGADVNVTDINGKTAKQLAEEKGHTAVLQAFEGNDVRQQMMDLVSKGDSATKELENFITTKGDVNLTLQPNGNTALHFSVERAFVEVCKMLLQHNAKINKKNKEGNTPLHLAVSKNKKDIVKLLLDNSADPRIKDNLGRSSVDLAYDYHFTEIKEVLKGHSPQLAQEIMDQYDDDEDLMLKEEESTFANYMATVGKDVPLTDEVMKSVLTEKAKYEYKLKVKQFEETRLARERRNKKRMEGKQKRKEDKEEADNQKKTSKRIRIGEAAKRS